MVAKEPHAVPKPRGVWRCHGLYRERMTEWLEWLMRDSQTGNDVSVNSTRKLTFFTTRGVTLIRITSTTEYSITIKSIRADLQLYRAGSLPTIG